MTEQILLHVCCAVCASYPLLKLQEEGFEPVVYFYNPNIHPEEEHNRRLSELVKYCTKKSVKLIVEDFSPKAFYSTAKGFETCPEKGERCPLCFKLRLDKTAQKAKSLNINKFTTTLSVSPHKVSSQIFLQGETVAKKYGREFLKYDFKKKDGFKKCQVIAKENNMYKQTYCGCRFSINQEAIQGKA